MTNKIINYLINTLLIIIFVFIFIYSKIVKQTIIYGINIWVKTLFPSIFPFLLVTKLLIYKNFHNKLNKKIVIVLSLLTGFPTGAIYVKELLERNSISLEEANKLIMYTSFSNPIFVISVIGETLLNNKKLGIFIYLVHVLSGLLIGLILRSKSKYIPTKNINNKQNNILIKSINESFETLINILGIVIFFLIIISIINTIIPNNSISIFIKALLELTTGVISICKLKITLRLKISIIGFILSFNGISVHYQIKSIIDDTKIKYCNYLYARIVHSILCFIITYLLFNLIYNLF